jgi:hypothetical protein
LVVDGVESNQVVDQLRAWGSIVRETYDRENKAEQVKYAADGNAAVTYMITELSSIKSELSSMRSENRLLKSLLISQVSSICIDYFCTNKRLQKSYFV